MTLKDMIYGLMKRDSYDLFMWITFLSTKIDCRDCIQICEESNRIPNCGKCIPTKKLVNKVKRTLEERSINNGKKDSKK